jgi:short-subunit dehydrogenase/acyl dehydratase/acyl carrier protein
MTEQNEFSNFKVGDLAVFQQSFAQEEFADFARLSGDHNPLHHDATYAADSEFERPIVPMHMTIAPLSRIAGMIFPGDPSLYLSHEVRSILPVYYGDQLTYSARVAAINEGLRALTIRVLVLRSDTVLIDAEMRVMSRLESWTPQNSVADVSVGTAATLVTGATGEIGTALALDLTRRGHNLVLVDRGEGPKRDALKNALDKVRSKNQQFDFVTADLTVEQDVAELCAALSERNNVTAVFHSASPALTAPLADLVQVNYSALQQIAEAVLPAMLARQEGVLANIGSVATERIIPGWHDYAAAKAMAGQFLMAFDKSHAEFGVRGLNVLSGLVATAYSTSAQGSSPAMVPQELAEAVLQIALDDRAGQAVMVEWNGRRNGAVGFHDNRRVAALATPYQTASGVQDLAASSESPAGQGLESQVAAVLRARLSLSADSDLSGAGVGSTPGWDSLRHIELVLELEQVFGIRYGAGDVEKMLTFESLVNVTRSKIGAMS